MNKEREFIMELHAELRGRKMAPILFHSRVDKLARIYEIKNPWNLLEVYIKHSNNPVIQLMKNNAFIFLSPYGKEKHKFIIERDIKEDISWLKKRKLI